MLRFALAALSICVSCAAVAQVDNPPVRFTDLELPVLQTFVITPQEPIKSGPKEPWPFTENEVVVACGKGAIAVARVGQTYAALNGYTSGLSDTMKVVEKNGSRSSIINTRDNQQYRKAGIVKQTTPDRTIGIWWGVLLEKARTAPACRWDG